MKVKKLVIMRGLPGSGKSTYVRTNFSDAVICSADNFFMCDGQFVYEASRVGEAHEQCKLRALEALSSNEALVIIDNTNSRYWEYEFYLALARVFGYDSVVIDLFDGGLTDEELVARNIHGVPLVHIQRMRERWEQHKATQRLFGFSKFKFGGLK
jgi:predicted kinase